MPLTPRPRPFFRTLTSLIVVAAVCLLVVLLGGLSGSEPRSVGALERSAGPEPALANLAPQQAAPATRLPTAAAATPTSRPSGEQQAPSAAGQSQPAWAANLRETGLWSGPSDALLFSRVPEGATFRVYGRQGSRYRVFYPGDRKDRPPGEAWVDVADFKPVGWPRWVRLRGAAALVARPAGDATVVASLKVGDFVEVLGEAQGSRAPVYYLGDGRVPPAEGWLEVEPAAPIPGPDFVSGFGLSRDLLASLEPETWIKVPYRSQLDGTPYAEANCGPTALGMVLEQFGVSVPQPQLRREVLALQPAEDCDDCGVYLQNLAVVAAQHGLTVVKLRDGPASGFHTWTQDEIRAELRVGRPVIAQVMYRQLPGHSISSYWGDHFIVLVGLFGDRFLYHDPVDVEGPGYSRLITAQTLDVAMRTSDYPYAAFAVGR